MSAWAFLVYLAAAVGLGVWMGARGERARNRVNTDIAAVRRVADERVSAAGVAAETSPGVVSALPPAPTPGHPDPETQASHIYELIIEGHAIRDIRPAPHTIGTRDAYVLCECRVWFRGFSGHTTHVAQQAANMLRADTRIAAATNKFRQ